MTSRWTIPFVDTSIIPDRNAGVGSLLWDLQNSRDPDRDGSPLLDNEFAFIDVGASRAIASTALKTLLVRDLGMDMVYVATERPEAVPYANATLSGDRAEKIRGHLSGMSPSTETTQEVTEWHYVVDGAGKVSSVTYSYRLYGNQVWESYFMGRTFLYSGDEVDFSDPQLNELLAPDVKKIETTIDAARGKGLDHSRSGTFREEYRWEKNPLQAGLAQCGISLQMTEVPHRIGARQNVLFLGNVLNHYPRDAQALELDRISANMEAGDLVIVQMDGRETPTIEVLRVEGPESNEARKRVRWIDSRKLELRKPLPGPGSWQQIWLKPGVERMASRLVECLATKADSQKWRNSRISVHQCIGHVFLTFFRALPTERTLRVAIREALRRLPSELGLEGLPVFEDEATDAYGGAVRSDRFDPSPIVSEAIFIDMKLAGSRVERTRMAETQASNPSGFWN